MKKLLLLAALAVPLAACADMTPTQQRALTGTAAGAGVGAVFGAIGGNAGLGAAACAGAGWSAGFSSIAPDRPRTGPSKRATRPGAGGHRRRRPNENKRPLGRSNRSAVTFLRATAGSRSQRHLPDTQTHRRPFDRHRPRDQCQG
jgi:hypothetical protein